MPLTQAKRVFLKNHSLQEVVSQIRFPKLLEIESELPVRFQKLIQQDYPLLSVAKVLEVRDGPSTHALCPQRLHLSRVNGSLAAPRALASARVRALSDFRSAQLAPARLAILQSMDFSLFAGLVVVTIFVIAFLIVFVVRLIRITVFRFWSCYLHTCGRLIIRPAGWDSDDGVRIEARLNGRIGRGLRLGSRADFTRSRLCWGTICSMVLGLLRGRGMGFAFGVRHWGVLVISPG